MAQDIAALIDVYEAYPQDEHGETLQRIAAERLSIDVRFPAQRAAAAALPKPFFSLLDSTLSEELRKQIRSGRSGSTRSGNSNIIEIRIR